MNRSYSLISASSSSSSTSKSRIKYDVFLSFRGETRNNFTSHLYVALCQKGIHTFKDNLLPRGQSISPELEKTIESSRCSVIILSGDYASSTWCLDELVKILQCKEAYKQIVLPIFYHVDPSHVRKQKGSIGEAFQRHEQDFSHNLKKVKSWRDALTEVANLAGSPLHDGDEAKFIQKFIIEVSSQLGVTQFNILEDLFGMDLRLKKLNESVCTSSLDDVHFIGICGMGGIGKTTLARAYYDWMSSQFEGQSFLQNIREVCDKKENGLKYLQNHLLSHILNGLPIKAKDVHEGKKMIRSRLCHKKVLIVLDDVDKLDQLEALAGNGNWFGFGSTILVTTRDESLLTSTYKDCTIHRVEQLNNSEGLQLFSWKAFKTSYPSEDYIKFCIQVIAYAKGLPLALVVLGSSLYGKTINEWESFLDRLKKYPEKKIVKVLQISFDDLQETEKNIFLDIACFFNGFDKDEIIQIMDSCGFYPIIGIKNLLDKSLIQNGPDNKIRMHDLLQEMGKEIVQEKFRDEPGKWSRLWDRNDLCHVLEKNSGTEKVEAIVCHFLNGQSWKAFSSMRKLRLLICSVSLMRDGLAYFPNELRILRLFNFGFTSLPSSFQPDQLVELTLRRSNIQQLWNHPMKPLLHLKTIDLMGSRNFTKFEDFGVVPNLEKLILENCWGLVEVHPSISLLRRLTLLNLNSCSNLKGFPPNINGLKSLKVLDLSYCMSLRNLPEDLGHLNSLEELHLGGTSVRNLPSSIASLKNLKILSFTKGISLPFWAEFSHSRQWKNIICTIVGKGLTSDYLHSLKKLDLSSCSLGDGAIPEDFGCLVALEELNLNSNSFSCLPACINRLLKLRILHLSFCVKLKSLGPELPRSLEMVWLDNCTSLDTFLDPLNKQCNLRCSACCDDCLQLVRRQGSKRTAFASLKTYLQNPPSPSKRLDILLPGNEIPDWFIHKSSGNSISFQLDPNWCNSKWMGFAFCVFTQRRLSGKCNVRIGGQDWGLGLVKCPPRFSIGKRDHLWLFYLPRDIYFHTKWQNNCTTRIEFSLQLDDYEFQPYRKNEYGCGVRLVYEQDIQDLDLNQEDEDLDVQYLLRSFELTRHLRNMNAVRCFFFYFIFYLLFILPLQIGMYSIMKWIGF